MKQVKFAGLSSMKNEEFFAVAKYVSHELGNSFPEDPEEEDYPLVEPRTIFLNSYNLLDEYMNQPTTDSITRLCTDRDNNRILIWRDGYVYSEVMRRFPEDMENRPQDIYEIYMKYGNPSKLSQAERTARLHNLLQELHSYQDGLLANKFDYGPWLKMLDEAEELYEEADQLRAKTKSTIVKGAVDKARTDCENALRNFLDMVNVVVKYKKSTDFDNFIDHVNSYISRQVAIVKTRITKAANKRNANNNNTQHEDMAENTSEA